MPLAPAARTGWLTARGTLALDRPRVVGILNVTPDSFWDGGRHDTVRRAVEHAAQLIAEGADLLDIGGESTRPGARHVDSAEERARILPVIEEVVHRWPDVAVSVDTVKADVAHAALEAGAAIVNDVSGLRLDPRLGEVVAAAGAGIILMHSRGGVAEMANYRLAEYGPDPVGIIAAELEESARRAAVAGIAPSAVVLDPGLGFAKRTEHSVATLAQLERIVALGRPVMVGPSRKRFLGEVAGGLPAHARLEGTIAACVAGLLAGARLFRVHDVAPVKRALALAEAVREAR
jgi:dihydropteroate synthase